MTGGSPVISESEALTAVRPTASLRPGVPLVAVVSHGTASTRGSQLSLPSTVLQVPSATEARSVVIGEVGGGLHGWALALSGAGTVEVCAEPGTLAEELLASGLTQNKER